MPGLLPRGHGLLRLKGNYSAAALESCTSSLVSDPLAWGPRKVIMKRMSHRVRDPCRCFILFHGLIYHVNLQLGSQHSGRKMFESADRCQSEHAKQTCHPSAASSRGLRN